MSVPEDLGALVEVGAIALSPGGERLAVATRRADLGTDGYVEQVQIFERAGDDWLPRPLPYLSGSSPAWAPGGSLLALVEHSPSGSARLAVHDLELRTSRTLLEWPDEIGHLRFSPSGRLLGFVAHARRLPAGVVLAERNEPPRVIRHLQFRVDTIGFVVDRPRHCYALELDAAGAPGELHALSSASGAAHGGCSGGAAGGVAAGDAAAGAVAGGAVGGAVTGAPGGAVADSRFDDSELTWLGSDSAYAFVSRRHEEREWDLVSDVFVGELALDGATPHPVVRKLTASDRQWGPLAYDDASRMLYARYALVGEFPCDEKLARLDPASGAAGPVELELSAGAERSMAGPLVVHHVGGAAEVCTLLVADGSVPLVALRPGGATGAGAPIPADASSGPALAGAGLDGPGFAGPAVAGPSFTGPAIAGHQGTVSSFDAAGGVIAWAESRRARPLEVLVAPAGRPAAARVVLAPNVGFAHQSAVLDPQPFPAVGEDGTPLDCWVLMPPAGSDLAGAALYVPGGGTQWGWNYVHDFQVLASAGIAVIFGNARGSGGYGQSWARAVCGPSSAFPGTGWGGVDRSDMLAMTAAALVAHPEIDRSRVAVLGGSYGGLMAALLGFTSDAFCAVVAERGPFDLTQMAATSDEGSWFFDAYIGATAAEDPEQYAFSSVLHHLDGVHQPVLIVHSEEDLRCPVQQAEELFSALRRRNADVTFVRFPGESHELSRLGRPLHRVQRIQIIRDWLVARLAGRMAAFELEA